MVDLAVCGERSGASGWENCCDHKQLCVAGTDIWVRQEVRRCSWWRPGGSCPCRRRWMGTPFAGCGDGPLAPCATKLSVSVSFFFFLKLVSVS